MNLVMNAPDNALSAKDKQHELSVMRLFLYLLLALILILIPLQSARAANAGYSEFFVPGDEDALQFVLEEIGTGSQAGDMHAVISATAWQGSTTLYYDHWEDGYELDPNDLAGTADEIVTLAVKGATTTFESANITTPRTTVASCNGAGTCFYDGKDRIIAVGGAVTLSRASWTATTGTVLSTAWEVFPVSPLLTTYIMPFGEDLAPGLNDFNRVYVLIQATEGTTTVTVDLDGNGTADQLCDRDGTTSLGTSISLSLGEDFLLDRVSACNVATLNSGTRIDGSSALQVQYIIGEEGSGYEIRGLSAFPRGFWSTEYYAPVPSHAPGNGTDIYLFNPQSTALTIDWETIGGVTGSFSIPATTTVSFNAQAGASVPQNSAVYLNGSDKFWGISTIDSAGVVYDWGYSLVPKELLTSEHYLAWAPGAEPADPAEADWSGVFLASVQDAIRVFVDYENDGIVDDTYDLARLESQFIFDATDGDMSNAHIWATGPYVAAYGQNPDFADPNSPAIDVGYTMLPSIETETVLAIEKTTNPTLLPTAAGSQAVYTLNISSQNYAVDNINVEDFLPSGWQYVSGSATITLADLSTTSGAAADPQSPQVLQYLDTLPGQVYNSNSENLPAGTLWSNDWTEDNDDGLPGSGSIQAINDGGIEALFMGESNNTNRFIARIADLSSVSGAVTLSFDYRRVGMDTNFDAARVYLCGNATNANPVTCNDAAGWTQVLELIGGGTDGSYLSYSVDLQSAGITPSATTAIRFETDEVEGVEGVYFTNISLLNETGYIWDDTQLGSLAPNQNITIVFTAETTQAFNVGDVTRNYVETTGTRTVQSIVQTFTASDFVFNSFGELEITKTSSGVDPLSPGDQYTYTVTVTNPVGSPTYTNVAIYDPIPSGVTYVSASGQVTTPEVFSALDQFSVISYANNDGTINWGGNWQETNTGDNDPAAGEIQVTGGELRIGNNSGTNDYITRAIDLSSYGAATLSYDYTDKNSTDNGFDSTDVVIDDGAGNTQIVFSHTQNESGSINFSIPASYLTAGFFLQIIVTETIDGGQYRYFDNMLISTDSVTGATVVNPSGNPPNFVGASDGYILPGGSSMTLTFDVTVDDPLANGINSITNTASATAAELPVSITASATNIVNNPGAGSATVGDFIWLDSNGDGIFDIGESGLANVEITLRDDFGTPLAVLTTDANGYYSFSGIPAGNGYYVQVTNGLPAGLLQTTTAGPVTNSTPKFNLTDGQNYTTADIGFNSAPGTTTVGDLVWSDANGDGVRDSGEAGLGGVSVDLWRDDGDGIWDPLLDTLLSTQTSASDGSYLFTGVTADAATDDYFVRIDPTQATLSGYTATTVTNYYINNAVSSSSYLNADYGFQASGSVSTYSITDRLWFDANADGSDGGGAESGIEGVTVNLLDASLNVVASATTDANGNISFTGVADGNYTLRVTDTANILVDYYGTTTAAISGDQAVTVNGANVTGTSYGYNLTRSIGDTVFNDLNGDGVQDAGEGGISGVTVLLYASDGTTLLATVTTNSNGTYLFSGLSDASYVVSIDGTQSALSGYALTTADDGGAGSPHTRNVTLSGGTSQLGIDYGYQASTSRSISGTLWSDDNQDGVIDTGEALLENVTVDLINSGGTVVATATTDVNGNYTFLGQPTGAYTVRVTDTNSVLTSYTQTYEVDAGLCSGGACDGETAADASAGDVSGLIFGYYIEQITTLVTLTDFQAYSGGGSVIVEWTTSSEVGTKGFWLERKDRKTKHYIRLNSAILPAISLEGELQGGTYQFTDATAKVGQRYKYRLIEEEVSGTNHVYGPFKLVVSSSRRAVSTADEVDDRVLQPSYNKPHDAEFKHAGKHFKHKARKSERKIDRKALHQERLSKRLKARKQGLAINKRVKTADSQFERSFDGAVINVRETGLYTVDAKILAAELGMDLLAVKKAITKGRLMLTNRGEKVSWQAEKGNSAITFFGEKINSLYTLDNVYQVSLQKRGGRANTLRFKRGRPLPRRASLDGFEYTEVINRDLFAAPSVVNDADSDFWFEGLLLEGNARFMRKSIDLGLPDVISGQKVVINMNGYTDDLHEVDVYLNDILLGKGSWQGKKAQRLTFLLNGELNQSGSNTLELVIGGTPANIVYYNSTAVSYIRGLRAVSDKLLMTSAARGNARVDGFTNKDIRVWDVTNAKRPRALRGVRRGADASGYYVEFSAQKGRKYLTVSDAARIQVSAEALQAPDWARRAEHLVIASRDLATSAAALVDYRNASGIPSQLILVEDIYQRYNDGIANPYTIRTFLSKYAKAAGVRYVVLAGSASLDYRDLRGKGDNFVSTLLTETPFGLFSCDSCIADLDKDNFADFIISRIPATDEASLLAYVDKLRAYESTNAPSAALLLADKNDPRAGYFSKDSDSLADLYPANYVINKVYLDDYPNTAAARTDMFDIINAGVGHINYIGHGGLAQFAASKLLFYTDMALMTNKTTPVLTALTCSVNRFEIPGFASLGERLVMDSDGGTIAVWAPSGLSYNAPAVRMNQRLLENLYQSGQSRVGEAINDVLRNTPDVPEYMLRIYNLIGDAAVQMN